MVAVAGLCVEVEDDAVGVGVGGAHLTVRVLSLAAFPGSPAAPQQTSRQSGLKLSTPECGFYRKFLEN